MIGLRVTHQASLAAAVMALVLLFAPCGASLADEALRARHELHARLDPENASLTGRDEIAVAGPGGAVLLLLASRAEVSSLALDGKPVHQDKARGGLRLVLPPGACRITVSWRAVFADVVPEAPVNFDNPGHGVEATIGPRGAFLPGGSLWHPRLAGANEGYSITLEAPAGMRAVTQGRLVSTQDVAGDAADGQGGLTISSWRVERPVEGLPLCAGRYSVRQAAAATAFGDVPVMTFFFQDDEALAETYLKAAARHVAFYAGLHGAYPFEKFAVVENFFPTGYGFPSFTLLGGEVLRLPFIPETSLRHEVAHCWWGNGVLVGEGGNWSEGLATYVADYLSRERASAAEARAYRLTTLRDYALLASGANDFPLAEFVSRTSPAESAVGYGKAMLVFHDLRRRVGEEAFWRALAKVYREKLFAEAGWRDFFQAVAEVGGLPDELRDTLLHQWVERVGAPVLTLSDVSAARSADGQGWVVRGGLAQSSLAQSSPAYDLLVPVAVEMEGVTPATAETEVRLTGVRTDFEIKCSGRPMRLEADPQAHVFRLLAPEEIPLSVNSLKGADRLTVVVSDDLPVELRALAPMLLEALSHPEGRVLSEAEAIAGGLDGAAVLFVGMPASPGLRDVAAVLESAAAATVAALPAREREAAMTADTLVLILPAPVGASGARKTTGLLRLAGGAAPSAVATAARKITHYGKFGVLAFRGGVNTLKAVTEPPASPLVVTLAATE